MTTRRLSWLLLILAGCGAPPKPPPVIPVPDAGSWWDQPLAGCLPQGATPRTVFQVVERINALPHPVSVACLVASLPRPLTLVASTSVFSAQPADGRRSPRLFIMIDELILSVVPAGAGGKLLEFSELVTAPNRTLKGELPFPVTGPLALEAPMTHVLMAGQTQTTCALCHRAESPHPSIDGGFVSVGFRPDPGNLVPLTELQAELGKCDPAAERDRCLLLVALLGLGPVKQGAFSTRFELFIQ